MDRSEALFWADDGKRTIDRARFDAKLSSWHVSRVPGRHIQTTDPARPAGYGSHRTHSPGPTCKTLVTHYMNLNNILVKKMWYHAQTLKQSAPPPAGPCHISDRMRDANGTTTKAGCLDAANGTKLTGKVFDRVGDGQVITVPRQWHSAESRAGAWGYLDLWRAHDIVDAITLWGMGNFPVESWQYDWIRLREWAVLLDSCGGVENCFRTRSASIKGINLFRIPLLKHEEKAGSPSSSTHRGSDSNAG